MKILVVDDFITNVSILRVTLSKIGHTVFTARNGEEAVAVLKTEPMDAVLTDWMMPQMDGFGLIKWIRSTLRYKPIIIVITALRSAQAETQALEAGADAMLVKPIVPTQLGSLLDQMIQMRNQPTEHKTSLSHESVPSAAPNFYGVGFGAGTGGAISVRTIFKALGRVDNAAFFIVLHGPGWAAEALAEQLRTQIPLSVVVAKEGDKVVPGTVYIAPGDSHMLVSSKGPTISLVQSPA